MNEEVDYQLLSNDKISSGKQFVKTNLEKSFENKFGLGLWNLVHRTKELVQFDTGCIETGLVRFDWTTFWFGSS